jgi:hypothetical protein
VGGGDLIAVECGLSAVTKLPSWSWNAVYSTCSNQGMAHLRTLPVRSIQLTVSNRTPLQSDKSSKWGDIAATDAVPYNQTPFLIQSKSSKRGVCVDPGDVRFEDSQL